MLPDGATGEDRGPGLDQQLGPETGGDRTAVNDEGEPAPADGGSVDLPDDPPPELASPDGLVDLALPVDGPPDVAGAPDLPAPDVAPTVNITDSLRAHWNFNEPIGALAVDDPVGNNDGTLSRGASLVASGVPGASRPNNAARFNGGDEYMAIRVQSLPSLQANKTISIWVNAHSLTHTNLRTILSFNTSSSGSGAQQGVQLGTDGGRPAMWRWGRDRGDIVGPPFPVLGWHHLVYTWDGQRHRLYLNGNPVGEFATGQSGAVANATLGCYDPAEINEMFDGDIDELRVYDRVINVAEIARLGQGE